MRHRRSWLPIVAPCCLAVILFLGWALTTASGTIPRSMLPTPKAVGQELYAGLISPGDMWGYLGVTVGESLLGCIGGFAVALPLSVLIYRSRVVSAAVLPFLGTTQAIPAVALAPLLAVWVGFGLGPIVLLCTVMVFFPILVSSVVGFRHISPSILGAAQLDGAGSFARLIHIEIPMALHSILAGVRNGFTLSVTGAVVGEMVMGGNGLGSLIAAQHASFAITAMFATIIVLAVVAAVIYSLVSLAERQWANLDKPSPSGHRSPHT